MFSSVVLPAPLGPMTERSSPSLTSTLTRLTACTPPNDLDTSRISSRALMRSREPALAPAVVLHVAVALALPDAGEPQIELLDVLVLADGRGRRRPAQSARSPSRSRAARSLRATVAFCSASSTATLSSRLSRLTISKISGHQHGRQPHRRLVEQHQLGAGHERPPDGEHLLLAARDIARPWPSAARVSRGKYCIHQLEVPLQRPRRCAACSPRSRRFSSTVRCSKTWRPSITCTTPCCTTSDGVCRCDRPAAKLDACPWSPRPARCAAGRRWP